MKHRDEPRGLPLFDWSPPTADVIPFPAKARVGKIRRTAEMIDETTTRGAEAYWRRTVSDLRRQMERACVPADRIETELRAFFDAVQTELTRRAYAGHRSRPGGDAA
ncbi:DUF6074 family protein [Jiella sonneratiae]|uniref:Uncharacterized protein n=1 Tax=Jiella sonneratiae TaxID=2816856 RepID=A0ABS3J8W1_9HYPH|nr:DUF6074 family protein [Jiella sonneratiae]MBO0905575.1 hypothetical protein [Jiella sonneratiae]